MLQAVDGLAARQVRIDGEVQVKRRGNVVRIGDSHEGRKGRESIAGASRIRTNYFRTLQGSHQAAGQCTGSVQESCFHRIQYLLSEKDIALYGITRPRDVILIVTAVD